MASNSVTAKTIGYRQINGYTFTINAELTGNTQGNNREIEVSFTGSAYNDGGYSPNYNSNTATMYINNSQIGNVNPVGRIQNGTTVTMNSWRGYVEAGQTAVIKGVYYAYGYTDGWMPVPGTYEVEVSLVVDGLKCIINDVSDFIIEDDFSLTFTQYDASFTNRLDISMNSATIKTLHGYESGDSIKFSDAELLLAYNNLLNSNDGVFRFELTTLNGMVEIGSDSKTATGTAKGTSRINIDGTWHRGLVWFKNNGVWKRALMLVNDNGWKRGS